MTAAAAGHRRSPRRAVLISVGVCILIVAAVAGLIAWRQHHRTDVSTASGQSGSQAPARTPESPATAVAGAASTGPVPAGYRTLTVAASEFNTTAGFAMAVPDGWGVSTQGTGVIVEAPGGAAFLQIDLTPHTFADMVVEARYLAAVTQRQHKFPGYAGQIIRPINLRGGAGAAWAFTWLDPSLGRVRALDLMYDASTPNGRQSYSLYLSSVATAWTSNLARVRRSNAYVPVRSLSPRRRTPGRRTPGRRTPGRRTPGRRTPPDTGPPDTRAAGHRAAGHRAAGHRAAGHRAAGHRAAGHWAAGVPGRRIPRSPDSPAGPAALSPAASWLTSTSRRPPRGSRRRTATRRCS